MEITCAMASIHSHFSLRRWSRRVEAPAKFVALGSRAKLALAAFRGGLKSAATAHFFEDTLGIKLGF